MTKVIRIAPKILNDCTTDEKGATAIFVAVVMLALIGMASLAIDIGYVAVTKSELQNAADASALAAARQLGVIYKNMSIESQQTYDFDPSNPTYTTDYDQILSAAKDVVNGGVNTAGGNTLTVQNVDITINAWKGTPFSNNAWEEDPPKLIAPTAVKVSVDTTIGFFFARIFGVNNMSIDVDSTAALANTSLPVSDPKWNSVLVPVGVSSKYFDPEYLEGQGIDDYCGTSIDFLQANGPCAAWYSVGDLPEEILRKMIEEAYEIPPPTIDEDRVDDGNDFLDFSGPFDSTQPEFTKFTEAFDYFKSGSPSEWLVSIVIFENPSDTINSAITPPDISCGDPNQNLRIVGFSEINLTDVSSSSMVGEVQCTFFEGRGFGSDFPLKGAIPALVR